MAFPDKCREQGDSHYQSQSATISGLLVISGFLNIYPSRDMSGSRTQFPIIHVYRDLSEIAGGRAIRPESSLGQRGVKMMEIKLRSSQRSLCIDRSSRNVQIRLIYNSSGSQQVDFARGSHFSHRVNDTDPET